MYAICVCKATRPVTVAKEYVENLQDAVAIADDVYAKIKLLNEFMCSGVAVIIVKQIDLEMFLTDRFTWGKITVYQFGVY